MHLYYEISINYYRIIDLKKRLIKYSDNYRQAGHAEGRIGPEKNYVHIRVY
jgi:hypothetical protein